VGPGEHGRVRDQQRCRPGHVATAIGSKLEVLAKERAGVASPLVVDGALPTEDEHRLLEYYGRSPRAATAKITGGTTACVP
jgi:hypothetical protein